MFQWLRDRRERSLSSIQKAPCPLCLRWLGSDELEWRCTVDCEQDLTHGSVDDLAARLFVSDPYEQSLPCTGERCSQTLVMPYPRNCKFPFGRPLLLPESHAHAVMVVGLESDRDAAQGVAAHHFALQHLAPAGARLPVADTKSMMGLRNQALFKRGRWSVRNVEQPLGLKIPGGEPEVWPQLLHLYGFAVEGEALTNPIRSDPCPDAPNRAEAVGAVSVLCVTLDANAAFDEQRRQDLKRRAELLADSVALASKEADFAWPELFLLVGNQSALFDRLGKGHGEPVDLLDSDSTQFDLILEGYVLDSLRLRSLVEPLLSLAFVRKRCGLFQAPFANRSSVAGLASWANELLGDAP